VAASSTRATYRAYVSAHWRELIERYNPWILWSDIGYPPGKPPANLFAHYYNQQPEGVVNDRWFQLPRYLFNPLGRAIIKQMLKKMDANGFPPVPHSDFLTAEYAGFDGIQAKKWEACRGIGNSFGYNQFEGEKDYLKPAALIRLLAEVVSKNGNLLLNVGPMPDGSLHPLQASALEGLADWLRVNGEAIYATRPWLRHRDKAGAGGEVHYTSRDGAQYAIVTQMPADGVLRLPLEPGSSYSLLASGESLRAESQGGEVKIILPDGLSGEVIPVIKILTSQN
jgi:alpha-L-fucosidase